MQRLVAHNGRLTMNDRELLEDAAKAAGMQITWNGGNPPYPRATTDGFWNPVWSPLTDNGDAFKLECQFGLDVAWFPDHVVVGGAMASCTACRCTEKFADQHSENGEEKRAAARRRATVRAAALLSSG